jgi:hypothetical protein
MNRIDFGNEGLSRRYVASSEDQGMYELMDFLLLQQYGIEYDNCRELVSGPYSQPTGQLTITTALHL